MSCSLIVYHVSSVTSDVLGVEQAPAEGTLDKTSERVAYNLNKTLPAGSKASLKLAFKGQLTGSMMGYYKSAYEEDGKTRYYALTQFQVGDAQLQILMPTS